MKFKLGDFVRFVDERREGYITRVIDNDMVAVTGEDDFEIPVAVSNLTLVHGHGKTEDTVNIGSSASADKSGAFVEKGIFLAVASDSKMASVAHFQLINTTSYQLMLTLSTEKANSLKGEFAGIVNPESVAKVFTASLAELSSWPRISIQILYYSTTNHQPKEPLIFTEKFNAKDFSGVKKNAPVLNQPAWLFQVDPENIILDAEALKESFFKPIEEKTGIARPAAEVDLHIEKLAADHQFLNSSEMLTTQLKEFRKAMEAAIVHKLASIIFIHGLGNGTLRQEIHKIVSKHPGVKTFMDARKEKFGYGATEIYFK